MDRMDRLELAFRRVKDAAPGEIARITSLDELSTLAESLLHAEVAEARAAKVTWATIGQALGVTRQAAFQRFGLKQRTDDGRVDMMQKTLLMEAPERTKDIVRSIAQGAAQEASSYFGAEAAEALPPEKLAKVWGDLSTSFGEWESFSAASAFVSDDHVVAEVRLEFEAGALTCRTAWTADGKLAGLFFLPAAE